VLIRINWEREMRGLLLAFALIIAGTVSAQDIKYCGQTEQTEALFNRLNHRQQAQEATEQLERETIGYMSKRGGGQNQVYIIPIVFHIIHDNGDENISDEQVYDAVEVLNRDLRMMNEDLEDVVAEFAEITADIEIEFRLAQRDPNGNCTKGINRIQSALTYEGNQEMKNLIQWPRDQYCNIWVCEDAGGAAGYTFLPGDVNGNNGAAFDGIVLLDNYTGSIGTSNNYRSRTLTHEVGHWLNLMHLWGGTNTPAVAQNCNFDDNVNDTPDTEGWTSCNLEGVTCGTLDNVQNYMEYSYCSRMFTQGQKARMRTSAESNISQRNELWQESNLIATGVFNNESILCEAEFSSDQMSICEGQEIQFFDESFNGVTEWTWETSDGQMISGSDPEVHQNPLFTFDTPGMISVTLTAGNGIETVEEIKTAFIQVLPDGVLPDPFYEGFEDGISDEIWFVNSTDNFDWLVTSSASYSGAKSIRINNNNASVIGTKDQLITSTMDLTTAAYAIVSYRYASCNRLEETDDKLRVSVSKNCGNSWTLRKMHRGVTDLPTADPQNSSFTPSGPEEWGQNAFFVDNPEFLVPNFRLMFELEAQGGNNVYIDDINITIYTAEDVAVEEIASSFYYDLYPNPMNEKATLNFFLAGSTDVAISMFDLQGREVQQVFNASAPLGKSTIQIDKHNMSSGMYILQITVGGQLFTEQLIVR
jgi:PKD repeat protein